jgi:hypothetical protein
MMCFFGSKQHRFRNFCLKSYETQKSSALPGIAGRWSDWKRDISVIKIQHDFVEGAK